MQRLESIGIAGLGIALSLVVSACDPAAGTGSVVVGITGEEAATEGLPFEEDGEVIAFADGWSVTFDHYLAVVGALQVGDDVDDATYIVDLAKLGGDPPGAELFTFEGLAAGQQPFSFAMPAANADSVVVGEADAALVQQMRDDGLTYYVAGAATKDGRTVTFEYPLTTATTNSDCTNGDDDKQGVTVEAGVTADAEITIHIEHLFYDTLGVEGPDLVFDPLAASAAADDDDLTAEELGSLTVDAASYDKGSFDVTTMLDYIAVAASSQAHLNGEGLCTVTRR
ncbi:MAG TPA: hypothetical protein VGF99_21520 [Myxococcota bacterium]